MVSWLDKRAAESLSSDYSRQIVENLQVAESGDRWVVQLANGHVVRGPYLNREQADGALEQIRSREVRESEQEEDE